jgi:hypothetical protein
MPVSFLSDRDRQRLDGFPADVPPDDLRVFFTLASADHALVKAQRGDHNRLGCALQLCALRYLGFAPDDLSAAPKGVVAYVAAQLDVPPDALVLYGRRREQTRSTHYQAVQDLLGFHRASEQDLQVLTAWLTERALEHDKPTLLLRLACERLQRSKIVRPGLTRLEKVVAGARAQANLATYERLRPLLTEERRQRLDDLLVVDSAPARTPLRWLRQTATANSAPEILDALAKLNYLRALGANAWDLGAINPNRLKFLAQVARKSTRQMLQRAPAERRYPVLAASPRIALPDTARPPRCADRCPPGLGYPEPGSSTPAGWSWPGAPIRPARCPDRW